MVLLGNTQHDHEPTPHPHSGLGDVGQGAEGVPGGLPPDPLGLPDHQQGRALRPANRTEAGHQVGQGRATSDSALDSSRRRPPPIRTPHRCPAARSPPPLRRLGAPPSPPSTSSASEHPVWMPDSGCLPVHRTSLTAQPKAAISRSWPDIDRRCRCVIPVVDRVGMCRIPGNDHPVRPARRPRRRSGPLLVVPRGSGR